MGGGMKSLRIPKIGFRVILLSRIRLEILRIVKFISSWLFDFFFIYLLSGSFRLLRNRLWKWQTQNGILSVFLWNTKHLIIIWNEWIAKLFLNFYAWHIFSIHQCLILFLLRHLWRLWNFGHLFCMFYIKNHNFHESVTHIFHHIIVIQFCLIFIILLI